MASTQEELSELADREFTPYRPGIPIPQDEGLSVIGFRIKVMGRFGRQVIGQ